MVEGHSKLYARLVSRARLKHLQLLLKISELHSLQKAAAAIGMSQPAATHALSELESALGCPIFERHSRGMRVNAAGTALIPAVRASLRSLQDATEMLITLGEGARGALKIGSIGAGLTSVLRHVLPQFSEDWPEVVLEVVQVEAEDLLEVWEKKPLDIVLSRPIKDCPEDSVFKPLLSDRYCVIGGVKHPLAGKSKVTKQELYEQQWLMQPPRSIASRDFYRLWEDSESIPRQSWVNTRSLFLVAELLRRRPLLTFVPYLAVCQLIDEGLVQAIDCELDCSMPPLGMAYRPKTLETNIYLRRLVDAMARHCDQRPDGCLARSRDF